MIKAVIFDIDGVLLDSFEANWKFFQNLMTHAGYPPPTRESYTPIFSMSMMAAIQALVPSATKAEVQRIWELGRSREIEYPIDLLQTPKGAEDVIKRLSAHYTLGIVTSRIRESVYEAPQLAKLQKYFRIEISYQDTNKHKPDPEPLLAAAKKLNVPAQHCVYVGDAPSDITAARAAGMKVIIYAQQPLLDADANTDSFEKLPEVIAAL